MQRSFISAIVALLAVGCGTGAAERPTSMTQSTDPEPGQAGERRRVTQPERQSQLTDEQREVLAPELRRYGSGWTLATIERSFTVHATEIPNGYELLFVARGYSGLSSERRIEIGGSFNGRALRLPEGPELTPEQSEVAAAALRQAGELWLIGTNGDCRRLDLSAGLASLTGQDAMQTRAHEGRAVLMTTLAGDHDPLVVVIDLDDRTILEAGQRSLPPSGDRGMLGSDEFAFIDRALRTHGSFGAYGDVTQGLRALMTNFRVQIRREEGAYSVSVVPPDGGGHELYFSIDRRTGEIGDMAAGHAIPAPE